MAPEAQLPFSKSHGEFDTRLQVESLKDDAIERTLKIFDTAMMADKNKVRKVLSNDSSKMLAWYDKVRKDPAQYEDKLTVKIAEGTVKAGAKKEEVEIFSVSLDYSQGKITTTLAVGKSYMALTYEESGKLRENLVQYGKTVEFEKFI